MDLQILNTQKWLNSTYGGVAGWVSVVEDGVTGWGVIYGLRRALQSELGVSPVSSGFGDATSAAFKTKVGSIDANSAAPDNLLRILSGGLWCKGYTGFYEGSPIVYASLSGAVGRVRGHLGLSIDNPFVELKLMKSLLSMDAYVIPFAGNGTNNVREAQQWLNATYSDRRDFELVPCDGIFSRQIQTAILYALQYEFDMADGVANGNFGPGTRDGLRSRASVGNGSSDGSKHFVRLYQAVMRFNRFEVSFTGTYDSSTADQTRTFQEFMQIPVTGQGDYTTWCNLLVSSGDTTISTAGFDTNRQLTSAQAQAARAKGYTHVGRYTVGEGKFITSGELDSLRAAGLRLFPLHQRYNHDASTMTYSQGLIQGDEALERGRMLGFPEGSMVYFSVDFDPSGEIISGPVGDFFQGVNDAMDAVYGMNYRVGVYGTRNVCQVMLDQNKAEGAFVAGMSTGFSGNMGFPLPAGWHYNQIIEVKNEDFGGSKIDADHDVVSPNAASIDLNSVVSPPVEVENPTGAGFELVFDWIVRAEIACEKALKEGSGLNPLKQYRAFIPGYILDWLRKPTYWTAMWQGYTPNPDATDSMVLARQVTAISLDKLGIDPTFAQLAHLGAATLGYTTWGTPTGQAEYGLGDLGGWPLDLLQIWGDYTRQTPQPDLLEWMTTNIGGDQFSFGYKDLLADADAWLISRILQESPSGLSDAIRTLYKLSAGQRIHKFYAERFGSSESNIVKAFKDLPTGLEVGTVKMPVTVRLLKLAAKTETMPDVAAAELMARVYARALARLGQLS